MCLFFVTRADSPSDVKVYHQLSDSSAEKGDSDTQPKAGRSVADAEWMRV